MLAADAYSTILTKTLRDHSVEKGYACLSLKDHTKGSLSEGSIAQALHVEHKWVNSGLPEADK